ncbi:MAG: tyrosine-type recombinase/integrase [Anaerolineae bacterium]|nr:tyrosine-type recombinase/integrase [Anaerolineae bacterium]
MDNPNAIIPTPSTDLALAGEVANRAAAQHAFTDYRRRKARNTLRRQDADLRLFAHFLTGILINQGGAVDGDLAMVPDAWRGITYGLVKAFVRWQEQAGYSVGSINVRLSTVKRYAALATEAGALTTDDLARIRMVTGHSFREGVHLDEQREEAGLAIRIDRPGAKKATATPLDEYAARKLKRGQPDTPKGRRDALLMCLLLDHGLRCGEVAALTVGSFNLKARTFTFYRAKVAKTQTHRLTSDTLKAARAYLNIDAPMLADAPLLRESRKGDKLTGDGMSERAITKRVKVLAEELGIIQLSAHDCRHYWATTAAHHQTDPFALQEAGGWNSLAMPRRYVDAAKIANEGVVLE